MSRALRLARGVLRQSAHPSGVSKVATIASDGLGAGVKSTSALTMTKHQVRAFGDITRWSSARTSVLHGVRARALGHAFAEEFRVDATRVYSAGSNAEDKQQEGEEEEEANENGEGEQEGDELTQLRAELEEKDAKVKDMSDRLLRTLAEMENLRERTRRQAEDAKKFAIQGFCKDLLDVADNLDRAIATVTDIDDETDVEKVKKMLKSFHEGVVMTEKQLASTFKKNDVVKFNPEGEEFDANMHMALFNVPIPAGSDAKAGQVAAVTKVGYTLADRVIRAAEVGVYQ